ncbi:MAG: Nif3-like dinuclear metal center hexameric protein [Bacteroidales bacterium]|jgi:putative NIF3 family GTP cyclohydrolase 1 type 2|nr:Nif3-like dinuclear metal center hexameric protein [Bacteroidales bacterium]
MKAMRSVKVVRAIDIAGAVEKFAPLSTQVEWDNSGFSVGDPQAVVHKVLIALDCTLDVVEEAVEKKCDMILTHHPLIFGGCKNILYSDACGYNGPANRTSSGTSCVFESLQGRAIAIAIKNGITIYSSHTPLDKARGGLNDLMAKRLNLQNCKVLSADGFGTVGSLNSGNSGNSGKNGNRGGNGKEGMTGEEFIKFVKKQFNVKYLRCSKPIGYGIATDCKSVEAAGKIAALDRRVAGKITKVAVSSGAGQGSVSDAIAAGAQALVTADVSHHNFYQPEGFMILDIGHYESEWGAVALLESIVKKNFSKFAVSLSKRDKSPIYYY